MPREDDNTSAKAVADIMRLVTEYGGHAFRGGGVDAGVCYCLIEKAITELTKQSRPHPCYCGLDPCWCNS